MMIPQHLKEEVKCCEKKHMEETSSYIQNEIIQGLAKCGNEIRVYNKLHIKEYPKGYKKCFIKKDKNTLNGQIPIESLPFVNLPFFSKISYGHKLKRKVLSQIKTDAENETAVICYACTAYNLKLLQAIKKANSDVITSIIIPDLPQYMYASEGTGIKGFLRSVYLKYMNRLIEKSLKQIDLYVLFSAPMAEYIGCQNKYLVVEGVGKVVVPKTYSSSKENEALKYVFYGGGISVEYGVKDLVDAFMMIEDSDVRLILCGEGNASEYVLKMAKKDHRIIYKGLVSYVEAQQLLMESDVVVNPRKDNTYNFTKYSFPSKILDTLSAGKPLIGYRLEGIPAEYENHLIFVNDHKIETLSSTIQAVCAWEKDALVEFGSKAKDFIVTQKSGSIQAKKINDELKRLLINH